jgi:THO complex subunit 7
MVARIAQEDQATFKRLAKKYQQYLTEDIAPVPLESRPVYLSELSALHASLEKARIVCEAEKIQAKEYLDLREELRMLLYSLLAYIHAQILPVVQQGTVKEQLESLREILDMEQEIRAQKVEYDEIAIKVNALPTRTRLVACVFCVYALYYLHLTSTLQRYQFTRKRDTAHRNGTRG